MHQGLREWYLGTMGIVQYVHRVGKSESVEVVETVAQTLEAASTRAGHRSGLDKAVPAITDASSPVTDRSPDTPGQANEDQEASSDQCSPFRLAYWRVSDELAVMDSMAPGRRPSPQHLELLGKILQAIGRWGGDIGQAEFIDWPANPGVQTDRVGARIFLEMFLEGRCRQRPFRWLLLMGESSWQLLPDGEKKSMKPGGRLVLECGATGVLTYSLEDMLNRRETKAETWRAIRFLAE